MWGSGSCTVFFVEVRVHCLSPPFLLRNFLKNSIVARRQWLTFQRSTQAAQTCKSLDGQTPDSILFWVEGLVTRFPTLWLRWALGASGAGSRAAFSPLRWATFAITRSNKGICVKGSHNLLADDRESESQLYLGQVAPKLLPETTCTRGMLWKGENPQHQTYRIRTSEATT